MRGYALCRLCRANMADVSMPLLFMSLRAPRELFYAVGVLC